MHDAVLCLGLCTSSEKFSVWKCAWWTLFLLHEYKCSFFLLETAFCRHSITHSLESHFQGLQLFERQTEIQRGTLESKQTDFNLKNDSYKVPNKTRRMCGAVTTASSNSFFTYFRKVCDLTNALQMRFGACWFQSHISFLKDCPVERRKICLYSESWRLKLSVLGQKKKKKRPDRQRWVICHGWLSKQGSLNEYFNWSITFLNLWLLTFLPAVSIGSSIIPN